jgi:GTP1/Obg family GTP-binding protein
MLTAKNASPNDLMDEMQTALHDLGTDIDTYTKQLSDLVKADNEYKEVYATTYLRVKVSKDKMTVGEIDAEVTEKVKDFKRLADFAEAYVRATREHMDWNRKRIEVAQSILSFQRSELEHTIRQEAWTP